MLHPHELSKKSYLRIVAKFVEMEAKVWSFYPTSWITNIVSIFSSVAMFFLFAQLMIITGHPFGENYFSFSILAALSGAWLGISLNSGHNTIRNAYWSRQLEVLLLSPVPLVFFIFASSVWSYIMATANIIITLILALLLGFNINPGGNLLFVAIAIILSNLALFGYGLIAASNVFILKAKAGGTGATPTIIVLDLIIVVASGSIYPLQYLPGWLQYLSLVLPHTFVFDAVRRVFLPTGSMELLMIHKWLPLDPVITDLLMLTLLCVAAIPVGRYLLKISIERAQREGDLTRWA